MKRTGNGFVRVLCFQEQQLSNNNSRDTVMHLAIEHDNALFEESRENIKDSLASRRRLDNIRDSQGFGWGG